MRAEDRDPWEQWWEGGARRELTGRLASLGYDERFVLPLLGELRNGATVPDLERSLPTLRADLGEAPDDDRDGACAISIALWWDLRRPKGKRFGAE